MWLVYLQYTVQSVHGCKYNNQTDTRAEDLSRAKTGAKLSSVDSQGTGERGAGRH